MTNLADRLHHDFEPETNQSGNRTFGEVVNARLDRRNFLRGGLGLAVTGIFAGPISACSSLPGAQAASSSPTLGFDPVPVSAADTVVVPEGYEAKVIYRWGDAISGDFPAFAPDNTGEDQAHQAGMHNDGMHFFPIEGEDPWQGSSTDGLLVVNHEYIESRYLHYGITQGTEISSWGTPGHEGPRDSGQVLKELNAHGVSVARIRDDGNGNWQIVPDPRNLPHLTGLTRMEIAGPRAGMPRWQRFTAPEGTAYRAARCPTAPTVFTPWNTYMARRGELSGYFVNHDDTLPRETRPYGVRTDVSRHNWHLAENGNDGFVRFDASTKADSPAGDYRNEANTFGWITEIDPFDPWTRRRSNAPTLGPLCA